MSTTKKIMIGFMVAVIVLLAGAGKDLQATGSATEEIPLPASLDSLYPPRSGQPVYLLSMLKLENYFSGIAADVMDNDLQGARSSFDQFKSQYMTILEMVPEWKTHYPMDPVENLGAQLARGDRGLVMEAFGRVGGICHQCHLATMVQAQQKYHWGDFAAFRVIDPLSRESVDYVLFKKYLSTSLAGISVNLEQGQIEQARNQFAGFRARFQALKGTCENCHDRESSYYVDGKVVNTLDRLEEILSGREVDPQAAGALLKSVGRQSCSKCHLVHVPAAMARAR